MAIHFKQIMLAIIAMLTIAVGECYSAKPHIININKNQYQAYNKNWSIGQDEKGVMYFGNDLGLLEFDGVEWELNSLPFSLTCRSLAVLSHNTIFTGSYEEFGRWDRDITGKLVYTSLSKDIDKALFKNDDFWKIWISDESVYFQSFTSVYIYDYKEVKRIPVDLLYLFLSKVRNTFFFQQMRESIYELTDKNARLLEGSEIFRDTDVRVILPYSDDKYLFGSNSKGLFIYDGKTFKEWNPALSRLMNALDLNCGILSSKGTYYLGTLQDGIFEVDIDGNVINHISSESTLQNNTVLSLYEDNRNNIWAALDRGISFIRNVDNMSFHIDQYGSLGSVYDAIIWKGRFFIGTNQGIFYTDSENIDHVNVLSDMKLVEGTQGQVWSLKIIDGKLYCCHNRGIKEIDEKLSVKESFSVGTGVYKITEEKIGSREVLLLSTYYSLRIIDRETQLIYKPGQISEPVTNALVDHLGNVWLEHAKRGVYMCRLNADLAGGFSHFTYFGGTNNDGLPYKIKLFKVGGRIVLYGDDHFFTYNDVADKIESNKPLNDCFQNLKDIKNIIHIKDHEFWALTNKTIYKFTYDGYKASITERYNLGANLSLVDIYENLSVLNDTTSIVCIDNGFLVYNKAKAAPEEYVLPIPHIESLQTINTGGKSRYLDLRSSKKIAYHYNSVCIRFSATDVFSENLSFQYKLERVDPDWSAPNKVNNITYQRLPVGEYKLSIRTIDNSGNTSETMHTTFEILPPWYGTIWAYIAYVLILGVLFYIVWISILKRYRNIHLQKVRYRETKRLRDLTGELRHKVEQKDAELFTQTSFIIHKNELILKLKDIIEDYYYQNKTNASTGFYQKINKLLNNNMDTDEDWKLFLIKFEEKHSGFFKRMKLIYPELTTTDLRLCACLKLNLETKEIASLMNLSVKAIENNRYRLRKKLNLNSSDNLSDFILRME